MKLQKARCFGWQTSRAAQEGLDGLSDIKSFGIGAKNKVAWIMTHCVTRHSPGSLSVPQLSQLPWRPQKTASDGRQCQYGACYSQLPGIGRRLDALCHGTATYLLGWAGSSGGCSSNKDGIMTKETPQYGSYANDFGDPGRGKCMPSTAECAAS